MGRYKKQMENKIYLCIFAAVEGSKVDKYVRKAQTLLYFAEPLEERVKSFYIDTLKQYMGFLAAIVILGLCGKNQIFWLVLGVGFLLGVVAPFWDLRQKLQKRQECLKKEYEQMIIKLLMYVGAGVSLRNAFEYVVGDMTRWNKDSVLLKEMQLCLQWMRSGQLETECYYRFGQRCDLPEYLRLGGLMAQNVRRGNSELINLLEKELLDAKEMHRHRIRREGEKVSTKLLGPMMLLLSMVMVMIMIPAFGNL